MENIPTESAPENPFELVSYKKIMVPKVLLSPGRERDLSDYEHGWNDQNKNRTDQITPKIERTELRSADDWYKTGATKCWLSFSDVNDEGKEYKHIETDEMMNRYRTNTKTVPHKNWSDDDLGSDKLPDDFRLDEFTVGKKDKERK